MFRSVFLKKVIEGFSWVTVREAAIITVSFLLKEHIEWLISSCIHQIISTDTIVYIEFRDKEIARRMNDDTVLVQHLC